MKILPRDRLLSTQTAKLWKKKKRSQPGGGHTSPVGNRVPPTPIPPHDGFRREGEPKSESNGPACLSPPHYRYHRTTAVLTFAWSSRPSLAPCASRRQFYCWRILLVSLASSCHFHPWDTLPANTHHPHSWPSGARYSERRSQHHHLRYPRKESEMVVSVFLRRSAWCAQSQRLGEIAMLTT